MAGSFDSSFDGGSFDTGTSDNSALQWTAIENAIWAWIVAGSKLPGDHVTWAQQTAPRPGGQFISMRLTMLEHRGRDWQDRANNYVAVDAKTITAVSTLSSTLRIVGHGLVTGQGPLVFGGTPPVPAVLGANYWPVTVDADTIRIASSYQNAIVSATLTLTTTGSSPTLSGGATTVPGAELVQRLRGPRRALLTLQCFAGTPTGGAATGFTSPAAVLHDAISSYAFESRAFALAQAGIGVGQVEPIRSIDGIVNTTKFEPRAIGTVYLHLASELVETSTYIQTVNATDLIPGPSITMSLP